LAAWIEGSARCCTLSIIESRTQALPEYGESAIAKLCGIVAAGSPSALRVIWSRLECNPEVRFEAWRVPSRLVLESRSATVIEHASAILLGVQEGMSNSMVLPIVSLHERDEPAEVVILKCPR
jgi:hypothetical protein